MRRTSDRVLFACAILLALPSLAGAAARNKLISKKFVWQVARTPHFDLHYYPGAEPLLPSVSEKLELAYRRVVPDLGVEIPGRSSFFLYLNHNDFEQTNIVDVDEGTGGVTEAFKNRFLVFNDGTERWLEHVITHEFVHVAQFNVLYSGFWKSIRLLKSVLYPLWFMEGMAEYFTGEIDGVQKDMVLRDAVTSGEWIPLTMLHGFNHVKPHQVTLAYKIGNAACDYIAEEYGPDKIGLLLGAIAARFDMGTAIEEILGLDLAELDSKLREELESRYAGAAPDLSEPEACGRPLTRPDGLYPVFNSNPAFLPDGTGFFYLSDRGGVTEVFRYDIEPGRSVSLDIQKRFPRVVENIHRSGSALSVSPDGRKLLFAGEKAQKDSLYVYDIARDRLKSIGFPLDGAASPQFSPDGSRILFIGMKNGVTDVYTASSGGKELRKVTDNPADENDVRFFPDGLRILFSREEPAPASPQRTARKLWVRDLRTGEESRLTDASGAQPAVSPDGSEILFAGDDDGISDLYRVPASGGKAARLTRVIGGNFTPAYFPGGKKFLFVSFRGGEQHIYESPAGAEVPVPPRPERMEEAAGPVPGEPSTGTAITRDGRPYRLRASTDFFFPIFFYSSTDGLFLSAYWQASENLGNHQVQAAVTYASALDFLNYQVLYSYQRFRPRLTLGFLGDTQDNVFTTTRETRREDAQYGEVAYPLGRFDELSFRFLTVNRRVRFEDDDFITVRLTGRENRAGLSFRRDVSQGRYLETTSGYRLESSYDESDRSLGSSQDYRNVFLTWHHFTPALREGTIAFRAFGGSSFGRDRQVFRVGGSDLLRGFGRFDPEFAASRFAVTNLELRFPLFLDLDAHVWFFFPDFLFKNVYGSVFTDNGVLWDRSGDFLKNGFDDVHNSLGLGLRFQSFVLQTFPVSIQLDLARRTSNGEYTFYLTLGPQF